MATGARSFDEPDESIRFPGIVEDLVEIAGMTVSRTVQEPGWRWSTDMRPLVGGDWCEARHVGAVTSGRVGFVLRDGTELELGAGEVYAPPGHDGYTVGDERAVMIEWMGMFAFVGEAGDLSDRMRAALLMTDVVASTDTLVRVGDVAWRELIGVHQQSARAEVERFRGRIVDVAGDGLLATFDSPAHALRCASGIRRAAAGHGLQLRAGVHVGEVVTAGDGLRGVAVHETARVMAAAAPGEILVSESVPSLVSSRGLGFEDRGEHELKGVSRRRLLSYSG